jgi:hypothetical protein
MPNKPDPREYKTTKKAKKKFDAVSMDMANKLGFNVPKTKVSPTPKPKASMTPKPKSTPMPKFTAPTLSQYKGSAAADSMTYKQYIAASKNAFDAKNKKR